LRLRIAGTFCAIAALPMLAACGGTSLAPRSSSPLASSAAAARSSAQLQSPRAEIRFGLSPAAIRKAMATRGAGYWTHPDKKTSTLFVADLNGAQVRIYNAKQKNPPQSGSITTGIDLPINIAADTNGTLYVANNGNSTVTEYPFGATSPSVTLSGNGLLNPNGVTVDKNGTVYVTSGETIGQCYVLVYPKGATAPSAQINGFGLPIGLSVDASDSLYVADATADTVWLVPSGSTTPQNLHLAGLDDDTGVAVAATGDVYVSNYQATDVLGFHPGSTTSFASVTAGMDNPYALGFSAKDELFVGNYTGGAVTAYKKAKNKLLESIPGSTSPTGIAVYPGTGF
jgi:serine/threonine-protein kinase